MLYLEKRFILIEESLAIYPFSHFDTVWGCVVFCRSPLCWHACCFNHLGWANEWGGPAIFSHRVKVCLNMTLGQQMLTLSPNFHYHLFCKDVWINLAVPLSGVTGHWGFLQPNKSVTPLLLVREEVIIHTTPRGRNKGCLCCLTRIKGTISLNNSVGHRENMLHSMQRPELQSMTKEGITHCSLVWFYSIWEEKYASSDIL